jgi:hypothetical protein
LEGTGTKAGTRKNFPAITVLFASGLSNPDWLIKMDAITVVYEKDEQEC